MGDPMPPRQSKPEQVKSLEATLWEAADRLRSRVDAAEYKHVVLLVYTAATDLGMTDEPVAVKRGLLTAGGRPGHPGRAACRIITRWAGWTMLGQARTGIPGR